MILAVGLATFPGCCNCASNGNLSASETLDKKSDHSGLLERPLKPKRAEARPATGKKKTEKADSNRPIDAGLTENPRRPVREGPDNLRQRAEWFRRRTGGAKAK